MQREQLWQVGRTSVRELETADGILASGRAELYGCVFGRDSLISALGFLALYERTGEASYRELVGKILRTLARLQGVSRQVESGEEPGKIIHEYRPDNHAHLTARPQAGAAAANERSWFVYPSGEMRNYDTLDATPLFLIAAHEYARVLGEHAFAEEFAPSVRAALRWVTGESDHNGDGFADYLFPPERTYGGLAVQSWMDSTESLFYEDPEAGVRPPYPIAPVEVQAYVWSAYARWGGYFAEAESEADRAFGRELLQRAAILKQKFNDAFVQKSPRGRFAGLAYAIDGKGVPLVSARSSMGHVLWASYAGECILKEEHAAPLVRRLLSRDLFAEKAGIRTLSTRSRAFDPLSYHNGSIWPHDTAICAEGFERSGFAQEAARVRTALLNAYGHFKTPIELYGWRRGFRPYAAACKTQAWSAVALLTTLSALELAPEEAAMLGS